MAEDGFGSGHFVKRQGIRYPHPSQIERLQVPGLPFPDRTVRDAERELDAAPHYGPLLDATYANTKRFPPPNWAVEDFVSAATGRGMTYTPYRGDGGVREQVSLHLSGFLGVSIDGASEVILTPGTQAALFAALAALVESGDAVLLLDPDYLACERILRFLGADVVNVALDWERAEVAIDFESLEASLRGPKKPRLLLLSNPNNPTGAVLPPKAVQRLAELACEYDLLVVIDELYARLVYDNAEFCHLIACPGMKDRCVTLVGPSKTESLSGYRIGAAVAPPAIVDQMEDVLSVTALRAPAYAQHVLYRWISEEDNDFVKARLSEYQLMRDLTVKAFSGCEGLRLVAARGTSYMFPAFGGSRMGLSDQELALRLKTDAGVLVNPGYQFGPRGRGHFRICFAQDVKEWLPAIDRMIDVLNRSAGLD